MSDKIITQTGWSKSNKGNLNKIDPTVLKEFWASISVEWKKETLLEIAETFRSKINVDRFILSINKTSSSTKLDEIMTNLYLCSEDMSTFGSKKKYNSRY
jgi:hypothetical protein